MGNFTADYIHNVSRASDLTASSVSGFFPGHVNTHEQGRVYTYLAHNDTSRYTHKGHKDYAPCQLEYPETIFAAYHNLGQVRSTSQHCMGTMVDIDSPAAAVAFA